MCGSFEGEEEEGSDRSFLDLTVFALVLVFVFVLLFTGIEPVVLIDFPLDLLLLLLSLLLLFTLL